ncbi:hypothetical protein FRC10_006885 [Ceratobasidium sp. 414]|nr:hypothetical protein FRC10_006885 [Ceratobasidium sp. 414]
MHARTLSSLLFLFTLLVAVLTAPVPQPEPELTSEDGELEVAARHVSTLEPRGGYKGQATYYNPSVGTGACGWRNKDSEMVVALSKSHYKGSCGKYVTVTFGGKSVKCKVVDLCPGCGANALDMSPAAFKKLAPLSKGVFQASWNM